MNHPKVDTCTHWLTRGKARDLVTFVMPSVVVRHEVVIAVLRAAGWADADFEAARDADPGATIELTGTSVPWDGRCARLALLGLCTPGGLHGAGLAGVPTYRELHRDVVAYGEAVASVLYDLGYTDLAEHVRVADALYEWVEAARRRVAEAVRDEVAGFGGAPGSETHPGAR